MYAFIQKFRQAAAADVAAADVAAADAAADAAAHAQCHNKAR